LRGEDPAAGSELAVYRARGDPCFGAALLALLWVIIGVAIAALHIRPWLPVATLRGRGR